MSRRGRKLTEEERALWRKVASTTSRRAPAPAAPPVLPKADPKPLAARPETGPRPAPSVRILKPYGAPKPQIALPPAPLPVASGLDRATESRLKKGKKEPDARLDLHGMTAQRAHVALDRFIAHSRAAGHRLVLVITGKGGPDDFGAASGFFGAEGPGVLRREAPKWLSTPPLSHMVVNVRQAHPRHGGGGALYVYLKRIR